MFRVTVLTVILFFLISGCNLLPTVPVNSPETTAEIQPSEPTSGWTDELAVMQGICFESAYDAAGRVFVLRNETELTNFFDLSDNSHLCRRPVQRQVFDFSTGRILAGLWSYGHGCTARHDVIAIDRDDNAKTLTMRLKFVTEGDCDYELVRPFWAGLSSVRDYEIRLVLEE
jgi:hypothetical protein